ncbi:hypothetical protein RI129_003081 [Pyrocoelia pectoralis]|uniref:Myb/SANT-like DNA-binding domain-containing protein n=1 Tax=Pyrocoelia pectoralis TaxID=417401 RepID=A0AAN7VNH4_9COLE
MKIYINYRTDSRTMASATIVLEDGEEFRCELQLSEEDAERASTDYVFAQSLLNSAKMAALQPNPIAVMPGPSSSTSSTTSSADDTDTAFKWPHAAILLLVETYRRFEDDLSSGKMSQKKVWEKIAAVMREQGHVVTGPQCMSKFNGMKRTYKAVSDHNSKSGNNPRSWPYFDLLQSLLGERPFMEPLSIASSSSPSTRMRCASGSSLQNKADGEPSTEAKKKRRLDEPLCQLQTAILESRRVAEEGKNRRHQEKIAKADLLMQKMDEFLKKL